MKETTKNTLKDLSSQLREIKSYIKRLNKVGDQKAHSDFVKQQNDLKRQYKYYTYVRALESFHSSYVYRLKSLRRKNVNS